MFIVAVVFLTQGQENQKQKFQTYLTKTTFLHIRMFWRRKDDLNDKKQQKRSDYSVIFGEEFHDT